MPARSSTTNLTTFALLFAIGLMATPQNAFAQSGWPQLPGFLSPKTQSEIPARGPIRWLDNPDQAMAIAQQTGRPILAYVTSDHCGYCRKMERNSWSQPSIIGQVNSGFVALRLDAKQHAKQIKALRVQGFPTTLLLTADGRIANGSAGYLAPEKLTTLLQSLPKVAENQTAAGANVPR